jgi:hypothetical protein
MEQNTLLKPFMLVLAAVIPVMIAALIVMLV